MVLRIARAAAVTAALLPLPWCAPALAANLQISPVSVSLRAGQGAGSITLRNLGEQTLYGQVRVFAWDQQEGEDVLVPTTDLVASPPIIEVAALSSQTVRLVRRNGQPPARERTYRLLVDEVPRADSAAGGVAIRLQYSVPVFVLPQEQQLAPQLAWSLLQRDGAWQLQVRNDGALHAQLGATTVRTGAGVEVELSKGLLGYVLPGRTRIWRLGARTGAAFAPPFVVRSSVNAQAIDTAASIE